MSRMIHRILMGIVVMPFVAFGWLLSVWLSEQAVQAADYEQPTVIQTH